MDASEDNSVSVAVVAAVAAGCSVVDAALEQPATIVSASTIKTNIEMVFCFRTNSFVYSSYVD